MRPIVRQLSVVAGSVGVILSTGCSASDGRVLRMARHIAGKGAIDCGLSIFPGTAPKHGACALGALSESAPFHVTFVFGNADARHTRGLALNGAGALMLITADSPGTPLHVLACPTKRLVPDRTVTTEKVLTCETVAAL